jgi:SAM-dependent methyltransferase
VPRIIDTYRELGERLDARPAIRSYYEQRVARRGRILDIGGRNRTSASSGRLRSLGATDIVASDIIPDYHPDLVDDITASTIEAESFDAVYCDAILEHVTDYWSAVGHIHRVLKPGGEAFFYVPFCFQFHDRMDYHRFTITELARMTRPFSEAKVFLPGQNSGYGWVALDVLTYGQIRRFDRLHARLAAVINGGLAGAVRLRCLVRRADHTADQAVFFVVYLTFNHGFCAWVRK